MCIRDRVADDSLRSGAKDGFEVLNGMPVSYTHLDVYKRQAELQRDASSGEAWFTYGDGRHIVYFNDAETLRQRIQAAFKRHPTLAGVAIWALGGEDPENWSALDQAFSNK